MTYALLEAFGAGDANGNAMIKVTGLAGFIDARVPEISSGAFGMRQVPQMSIRGSDFAIGAVVTVLEGEEQTFPATLSHVEAGGPVSDGPGGAKVVRIEAGRFFGVSDRGSGRLGAAGEGRARDRLGAIGCAGAVAVRLTPPAQVRRAPGEQAAARVAAVGWIFRPR